jgi:SAM-dependent methyltransferase
MKLTVTEWHQRFCQQARWTYQVRAYLFERAGLGPATRVLDVGCGTGAILQEIEHAPQPPALFGLDIAGEHLGHAQQITSTPALLQADAHIMPYADASFDVTCCHFLLLWVGDPHRVLAEMRRVTRPGGAVLALAEPDYGGRIDHPAMLIPIGSAQTAALQTMGADPLLGRKLRALFQECGLAEIETGVLGGQWDTGNSQVDVELEQKMLRYDLAAIEADDEKLNELLAIDTQAWKAGKRTLFIPTFYAFGRKQ